MPRQAVRVHIFNQSYSVVADDPRETEEIAREIDDLMTSIASRGAHADSARVAVLACFHLADQLRAARKQLDEFREHSERISNLLEDTLEAGF